MRLPFIPPAELSPEQKLLYDDMKAGMSNGSCAHGAVMIFTSLIFVSSDGMSQSREARTSAAVTLPCLPPKCPMT